MHYHEYQQRVIDEQSELDAKREKLASFILSERFSSLDSREQERMKEQAQHMNRYSSVLGERIAAFTA